MSKPFWIVPHQTQTTLKKLDFLTTFNHSLYAFFYGFVLPRLRQNSIRQKKPNYILNGGIVMATASELRERIRELETELEEKDENINDLQDTIDEVYQLVSPESEDEDDSDSDEIED